MRLFFLSLLSLVLTFEVALSQTTNEEYNYVRKGLKIQLENGLDMKRGYSMESIGVKEGFKNGLGQSFGIEFFYLVETANYKKKAIIAAYTFRGHTEYYCIPTKNSSQTLWSQLWDEMNKFSSEQKFLFSYGLAQLASKQGLPVAVPR